MSELALDSLSDSEKWHLLINSLVGGLDYEGVLAWLLARPERTLDAALKEALAHRGGTVATWPLP